MAKPSPARAKIAAQDFEAAIANAPTDVREATNLFATTLILVHDALVSLGVEPTADALVAGVDIVMTEARWSQK